MAEEGVDDTYQRNEVSAADGDASSDGGKRRMALVLGIITIAVVALIAYLMWPRTPDHVLVVGDSVTFMSWNALNDEFGSDTTLEPVARPGFRSTDLLPLVQKAIDDRASSGAALDRAIFLVGYNDVWQDNGDDRLEELVELSARYECAVWLTLPTRPAGEPPASEVFDPTLADQWNERMADLVDEHRNLHLVTDWADAIEGSSDTDVYLDGDGIHPNLEGQKLLAETMYEAITNSCRFPEFSR